VPSALIDPTDIVALVLMALFAMRRIEVRSTDPRAFPDVPAAEFEAWKARALRAPTLAVNACFAKFFLNTVWFYGMRSHVPARALVTFGAVLFFGWIATLAYAFWLSSGAKAMAKRLGIVVGRRMVEERRSPEPPAEEQGV
jgi:hypothetical protein